MRDNDTGLLIGAVILIVVGLCGAGFSMGRTHGTDQFIKQFCNSNKAITLEQHQKCIWRMEAHK